MHVRRRSARGLGRSAFLYSFAALVGTLAALFVACQKKNINSADAGARAKTSTIRVIATAERLQVVTPQAEFDLSPAGTLRASLKVGEQLFTLDDRAPAGQRIISEGKPVEDITFDLAHASVKETAGKIGTLGQHIEVTGASPSRGLAETLTLEVYDDFPAMALLSASFRNRGTSPLRLDSVSLQEHRLNASLADPAAAPHDMWAFFGASLKWGKDEILRVPAKFSQENPLSLPIAVDGDLGGAGGGLPVVAFWTRKVGSAIGHIETLPLVVSLPTRTDRDDKISAAVKIPAAVTLQPGETYSTPRTFQMVYRGDYYEPLSQWSKVLEREGLERAAPNQEDYAVSWCSWGYKANVTPKQMLDTVPRLKELGIHWATLDDRWYNDYGDWQPRADTFPGDSTRQMVKQFHDQGIKLQIWWLPIAVEDGQYSDGGRKFGVSDVVKEHPEWLILERNGKHARMTRNLAALCPAVPEVQAYYKRLTERFIRDWDFDGHKLDNIFAVPQCFNPAHHHKSPNDSVYAMGEIYKQIFETTRALKPESVTQSCPCGTPPGLAWFRYMDQAVTADPISSVQVRRRIKMYKALAGPRAAVYGDHVELTRIIDPNTPKAQQLGVDFASTLGTGGVPGTKFTLPEYRAQFPNIALSPEKEAHWKKWIALYNDKMLSQGDFRDLYTFGYDQPEAYAIEKDGNMFYAFYVSSESPSLAEKPKAKNVWKGSVELRGLEGKPYRVLDYVNNKDLGTVRGPIGKLAVEFQDDLLIQAVPLTSSPTLQP